MRSLKSGVIGLLAVATAGWSGAAPCQVPAAPLSYSQHEIHDYAGALSQILIVHRIAADKSKGAAPAERLKLAEQSRAAVANILSHFGFTQDRFNLISDAIEDHPTLRREVRRLVMNQALGYQ